MVLDYIYPGLEECLCGLSSGALEAGMPQTCGRSWSVKAVSATPATGLQVVVGSLAPQSTIEVFETEADKYSHVTTLTFSKKRYRLSTSGKRRGLKILAPLALVSESRKLAVSVSNRHFVVSGNRVIRPNQKWGVAIGELTIRSDGDEARGSISVSVDGVEAVAELFSVPSLGAPPKINLEDIDLVNQRYRWRKNVLDIAARHPSLSRYLGPKAEKFPGQESMHFRLLIAEIVADAVCTKLLGQNIQSAPEEYEDADWDQYYAEYSRLMTAFLPTAHKSQVPEGG